ncbi:MAG: peptidyl-prolyl cis-trans isomerase [Candidatus Symbiothrix sp.]|jgi:hypothetical protein|nr:peptidyl-prolyl cis-trans isomerase [Candidatus Symbiothrix sp.]
MQLIKHKVFNDSRGIAGQARNDRLLCILFVVFISFLAVSCGRKSANNVDAVVQVGDKFLTREEIAENLPSVTNADDSVMATEHYIRLWISDNLLYDVAAKNIVDKENINQLVENYRKSLVIYQYQEQLINEKLSREISNRSLLDYFEANKTKFKLDKSLVKGLFLRIPINAPQIDKVRSWYKSISTSSIDNIEKYSLQNSANFDYFVDDWLDFNDLVNKWPVNYRNDLNVKSKYTEQKDDNYYYLLHITDYLLAGDNAPFEYAKSTIREILINQKKIEFLRETEEDLYNKALNSGKIKFFNE